MKQRSIVMAMFLVLASGRAAAAGGLNLPSGQQSVALPNLNTTTSATGASLPAMPATTGLPTATPTAASHAAHAAALPGLDGLGEAHGNAIRPIRIPGGGNSIVLPPVPGITSGSASGS